MNRRIEAIALHMNEVKPGDALAELIMEAARSVALPLQAGDIVVVKHKVVSKSEGRLVKLASIKPSARARRWATVWQHDARLVELALQNASRIVRMKNGVLITETEHGLVCANSGIDVSNVDGGATAALLPRDPDRSARRILAGLRRATGLQLAVIIADSFGRPWREGLTEVAIGVAGLKPLVDFRGRHDPQGYELHATVEAVADELAGLAGLACGKLERTPVCVVRGYRYLAGRGKARQLVRPAERDLFR